MRRNTLFWGLGLMLVGALLLLNTLGIIKVNVWGLIWPSILIFVGGSILWGALAGPRRGETRQASIPLDGAAKAEVQVNFGAGRLVIGGAANPGELLSGTFVGGFDYQTSREADTLRATLRNPVDEWWSFPWMWGGYRREWTFGLNPQIPLSLTVNGGASESRLDLSTLKVAELKLSLGASSAEVTLPANAGFTQADIDVGAASVDVRVPAGVAARIRFRGGAASFDADPSRFPRTGDYRQSPDYGSAPNKIDLHINAGAGSANVR